MKIESSLFRALNLHLSPGRRRWWRFDTPDYLVDDQPAPIMCYHRSLNWYAARLRETDLLIDTLDEPIGDDVLAREKPQPLQRGRIVPSFLVLGAVKVDRW